MIINHHGYNTRTQESDVALLKLQQPLVFNQFVRPIDVWMTPLPPFRKCTITGWGSTRESEDHVLLLLLLATVESPRSSFSSSSSSCNCRVIPFFFFFFFFFLQP